METNWKTFLSASGANIQGNFVNDFGNPEQESNDAFTDVITDLSYLNLLTISGDDTETFLSGQFTSDISQLQDGKLQCSAWCNPKGRVIANFLMLRQENIFYLLLPDELKNIFIQRLRMYILRADVSIQDQSNKLAAIGVRGNAVKSILTAKFDGIPEPYQYSTNNELVLIALPDETSRYIIIGRYDRIEALWQSLSARLIPIGSRYWQLFDILSGHAWVYKDTSESFLPQELNLDLLGGLSFSKGCFPGQEVIARLHYRGREKKRLYLGHSSSEILFPPATKLYRDELEQSIGTIVNSAAHPEKGMTVLAVVDSVANNHEILHIHSADGPDIQLDSLPYPVE